MGIGSQAETAFAFEGRLKEFYPIAWRNSLLTFASLGLYRSWAINKERQYLWGKTRFIDENIEWMGTGWELFRGFVIGTIIFFGFTALSFYLRNYVIYEQSFLNYVAGFLLYCIFFWLTSLAGFRGLRYRLSRTTWRGIRGGSNDSGFRFATTSVGRYILCLLAGISTFVVLTIMASVFGRAAGAAISLTGALLVGLGTIPVAMSKLFGYKWQKMSFGPHEFAAEPEYKLSRKRIYLLGLATVGVFVALALVNTTDTVPLGSFMSPHSMGIQSGIATMALLSLGLFWVAYRAIFNREAVSGIEISTIDFAFTARTKDWLVFMLGQMALTLLSLGIATLIAWQTGVLEQLAENSAAGRLASSTTQFVLLFIMFSIPFAFIAPYVRYRRWRFFIRHVEAGGEIDVEKLTQSETKANKDSEGLLDAFDFGAI